MSSMQQEQPSQGRITQLFTSKKLTGYDIATNNELSQIVRRDSTDFAMQQYIYIISNRVIKHQRGREIVCELVDVALRPRVLMGYVERKRKQVKQQQQHQHQLLAKFKQTSSLSPQFYPQHQQQQTSQLSSILRNEISNQQPSKQLTTTVYNAIQILTNQYQQFVQFIFDQVAQRKQLVTSVQCDNLENIKKGYERKSKQNDDNNDDNNDDFADFTEQQQQEQYENDKIVINSPILISYKQQQQFSQPQLMSTFPFPQLSRNEQDEQLKKIMSTNRINPNDNYKCSLLDRMFLLFYQPIPIQQTPVSYFNKIMLQFVYQKPQEIMRYFYCSDGEQLLKLKTNNNNKNNRNNTTTTKRQKITTNNPNQQLMLLSTSSVITTTNNQNKTTISTKPASPRIRLLAKHLYNSSVIQLLVHLMQLQSQGNFFPQQKAEILKAIVQQVFSSSCVLNRLINGSSGSNKRSITSLSKNNNNQPQQQHDQQQQLQQSLSSLQQQNILMQTSTITDLVEDRINNFIIFIKQLYQKLQDRYQQQKYLSVFRYFVNDHVNIKRIINYFKQCHNYFDLNGLVMILTLVLKFDHINFIKSKSQQQKPNPFGSAVHDHFGFGNNSNNSSMNKEDSSIVSYDLKLSQPILQQIKQCLTILTTKYRQQQASTMRMIQYYQLLYNWLNITMSSQKYQQFNLQNILTVHFINDCLFKFQEHQRSSILHNVIKNILVDFLPKHKQGLKVILAPECELVAFIQNYLYVEWGDSKVQVAVDSSSNNMKKVKKRKPKCFQNQLFHIGKAVLSIWQQQKMLSIMKRTQQDNDYCQQNCQLKQQQQQSHYNNDHAQSPTSDSENHIRFQKLRQIITRKEQFYNHLICGDPRKMGQYQQQQSSQIIMASSQTSSLKNFFKPSLFTDNNVMIGNVSNEKNNIDDVDVDNNNGEGLMQGNNFKSLQEQKQPQQHSSSIHHHQRSKDRYAAQNDNNIDQQQQLHKSQQQQQQKKKKRQQLIKNQKKLDIQDLKRDTNLKTDPKFRSLRIGQDSHTQSLFQSAISPLNANRSHTFNFQMDALPLDSENSQQQQAISEQQQDFPLKKQCFANNKNKNNNKKKQQIYEDDEMKLMSQNIQNFDMVGGNFLQLGVDSNLLSSSNNSLSQERSGGNLSYVNVNVNSNNVIVNNANNSNKSPNSSNLLLLSTDNYRREQLSKSVDMIPQYTNTNNKIDSIQRVDSYVAIQSPRKQSQDEILSLGMQSRGSKSNVISQQQRQQQDVDNNDDDMDVVMTSDIIMGDNDQFDNVNNKQQESKIVVMMVGQQEQQGVYYCKQQQQKHLSLHQQSSKMQNEATPTTITQNDNNSNNNSQFTRHYSSYLKYDLDDLCMDLE